MTSEHSSRAKGQPLDLPVPNPMTKKKMLWLILTIAALPFLLVILMIDDWGRDWTTNTASTSEQAADPLLKPRHSRLPPDSLAAQLQQWTESQPRWNYVETTLDGEVIKIHLTHSTRVFRFVDDVHVRVQPTDSGSVVHANSASRVGKGDLGQNPRNLRELARGIDSFAEDNSPIQ